MLRVRVTWLGHASFRIDSDDTVLYIDPYAGGRYGEADLILITHSHYDHCDTVKVREAFREGSTVVAPADCAPKIGVPVTSLRPGARADIHGLTVEAVEAYNFKRFRSPGMPFHPRGLGVGYLLSIGGVKIYHAGDTDFIPEMKDIKDVEVALLPIGGTYTMDAEEAAEAALTIRPRSAVPMHSWDKDPVEFKRAVESRSPISVHILKPRGILEVH